MGNCNHDVLHWEQRQIWWKWLELVIESGYGSQEMAACTAIGSTFLVTRCEYWWKSGKCPSSASAAGKFGLLGILNYWHRGASARLDISSEVVILYECNIGSTCDKLWLCSAELTFGCYSGSIFILRIESSQSHFDFTQPKGCYPILCLHESFIESTRVCVNIRF